MPARVLATGLDAAEATLIERWAHEGRLPGFARLEAAGTCWEFANSLETLPGAIWPEITSGRSCGQVPLYYHPRQLHTGEARVRPVAADEVLAADSYWAMASRAGCRVAAIDQPQTVPPPGLNGIQLCEWGLHDRNFAIASEPPDLLDQVCARHGEHPVRACDLHGEVEPGYRRLLDDLLRGVERKTDLLLDLLGREEWDLFTCTYGETHCAGHQFWDFWDGDGATIAAPDLHDAIARCTRGLIAASPS